MKEGNKNFLVKIGQLLVASFIFIVFSFFIGLLQDKYNGAEDDFIKGLIFASVIFYGGFSYDIAKYLAFLDSKLFKQFYKEFKAAIISLIIYLISGLLLAIFISNGFYEWVSFALVPMLIYAWKCMKHLVYTIDNASKK